VLDNTVLSRVGFPHSEIPGSKVGSHLPEAYRRHPTSFIASISQGILHLPIKIITLTTHLLTTKIKPKGGFWLISPYSIFKVPDNQSYKRKNRFREAIFIQTPQIPLSAKTASLSLKNICLFFHLTSVSILTNSKTFVKSHL